MATQSPARPRMEADPHSWITTETIETGLGNFEFEGGYPTPKGEPWSTPFRFYDPEKAVFDKT
jgi:hypothetical protein